MKHFFRIILRYLPLIAGIVILSVAATFVPWSKVIPFLYELTPIDYVLLILLSMVFYFGRTLRYWLSLKMLGHPVSIKLVGLACLVAQPVSVLPGGELYRSVMLKRYGNVPLRDGTASVFAQSLTESIGLVAISLVGAWILGRYVVITTIIAVVFTALWAVVNFYTGARAHRVTNLIPGVNLHYSRVRAYLDRNRTLLSGWNFVILLAASLVSTGAGIGIVAVTSIALDQHITLAQAALAYALPVTFEVVSFVPAGIGANEGSSVGILTLYGFGLPVAVAITLIVRIFTLGIGFLYGFIAIAWAHYGSFRRYDQPKAIEPGA